MSFQAIAWAVRQKLPAMQKIVLMMLADRHNGDTGRCDPSHDRLAEDCGMGRRTVIEQIAKLKQAGLIEVVNRTKDGVKSSNSYKLNIKPDVHQPHIDVHQPHRGSAGDAQGVVHQPHINQEIKPVNEPTKDITPDGVSTKVWRDFVKHRKALKASVTETAINGFRREAAKAGMSLEQALITSIENNWRGFKAEWIKPSNSVSTLMKGVL